jgi:hypothetical protein
VEAAQVVEQEAQEVEALEVTQLLEPVEAQLALQILVAEAEAVNGMALVVPARVVTAALVSLSLPRR